MRFFVIWVLSSFMLVGTVQAQYYQSYISCPEGSTWCPGVMTTPSSHLPSGDADLDKAITLCDWHRDYSGNFHTEPETKVWQKGFEACSDVNAAWDRSEAGRRAQAQAAKDEADKSWLADYDKKLKSEGGK
jgi:hypothetical protein